MFECHLKIGETAEFSKTITETDLAMFSAITGDFDPIHVNEDYAAKSPFGKRIAHGGLVLGLLSSCASDDVEALGRTRRQSRVGVAGLRQDQISSACVHRRHTDGALYD